MAQSITSISVLANTSASQLLRAKAPVNKVCIMGILLHTLSDIFGGEAEREAFTNISAAGDLWKKCSVTSMPRPVSSFHKDLGHS